MTYLHQPEFHMTRARWKHHERPQRMAALVTRARRMYEDAIARMLLRTWQHRLNRLSRLQASLVVVQREHLEDYGPCARCDGMEPKGTGPVTLGTVELCSPECAENYDPTPNHAEAP